MKARLTALLVLSFGWVSTPPAIADNLITMTQFESWIFGHSSDEQETKDKLEATLEIKLGQLDLQGSSIDPNLLEMAGKGDIARFFRRVDRARHQFVEMGPVEMMQNQKVFAIAMPLRDELSRGLFGDQSLLLKVARQSAGDGDIGKFLKQQRDRQMRTLTVLIRHYVQELRYSIGLKESEVVSIIGAMETELRQIEIAATENTPWQVGQAMFGGVDLEQIIDDPSVLQRAMKLKEQAKSARQMMVRAGALKDE